MVAKLATLGTFRNLHKSKMAVRHQLENLTFRLTQKLLILDTINVLRTNAKAYSRFTKSQVSMLLEVIR